MKVTTRGSDIMYKVASPPSAEEVVVVVELYNSTVRQTASGNSHLSI